MPCSTCGFWSSSVTNSFTGVQANARHIENSNHTTWRARNFNNSRRLTHAYYRTHNNHSSPENLRVTHHFIIVESLMTDVMLGIDFQREYQISYDWDEEKRCYIRHKGQFLCYTEDMESGINRVSIAKTIRIPPKHIRAISVSIRGHNIKTPTACFIGSQYTDPEVKLIDGVHDISHNVTLQVLVINNSNQHVNFPKGMKIEHLEPPIDELAQIPINSATTQWMLPESIKPDSFTPPKYQLDSTIQQQLDNLLETFKDQFTKDETTIGTTPLTQMSIDTGDSDPVSQKPYPVAMKHYIG